MQLVVVTGSDNEAERLVTLFRNAGRVARAKRPRNADELRTLLDTAPDLVVIEDGHPDLPPAAALEQCCALAPQISAIMVTEDAPGEWFRAGAADVAPAADEERLVGAALREVNQARLRRQIDTLRQQLDEAEQRNSLLLAGAQDAIAYISDGMVIHANALFAERFGFGGPEDLDCAPIVDLIAERDLDKVKAMLKALANTGEPCEFVFEGQRADGATFTATMQLCASNYDGEACTQLNVRDDAGTATADSDGAAEGLDNSRQRLETELGAWLTQLGQGGRQAVLVYLSIDDYSALRDDAGLLPAVELSRAVGATLATLAGERDLFTAWADEGFFCLLDGLDAREASARVQKQLDRIAGHSFETQGGRLTCTVSAGVVELNAAESAPQLLDQAFRSARHARAEQGPQSLLVHKPSLEKRAAGSADELDLALEEALEEGRFRLAFQPVISLRGSTGEHYEVTLRMLDEEGQETTADAFLETLAQAPGNTRLDRWIIVEATKLLAEQRQQGNDTRLLLNVTGQVLADPGLPAWLGVALKAADLPPESLIFQCHSASVSREAGGGRAFSEAVRGLGCRFSLADFGTGDNAIALLDRVPADMVQLDASLCRALQSRADTEAVKVLMAKASERGAKVIVTEVENAAALATLWQVGADFIQGNYLQPPTPTMDYEFTDIA